MALSRDGGEIARPLESVAVVHSRIERPVVLDVDAKLDLRFVSERLAVAAVNRVDALRKRCSLCLKEVCQLRELRGHSLALIRFAVLTQRHVGVLDTELVNISCRNPHFLAVGIRVLKSLSAAGCRCLRARGSVKVVVSVLAGIVGVIVVFLSRDGGEIARPLESVSVVHGRVERPVVLNVHADLDLRFVSERLAVAAVNRVDALRKRCSLGLKDVGQLRELRGHGLALIRFAVFTQGHVGVLDAELINVSCRNPHFFTLGIRVLKGSGAAGSRCLRACRGVKVVVGILTCIAIAIIVILSRDGGEVARPLEAVAFVDSRVK